MVCADLAPRNCRTVVSKPQKPYNWHLKSHAGCKEIIHTNEATAPTQNQHSALVAARGTLIPIHLDIDCLTQLALRG